MTIGQEHAMRLAVTAILLLLPFAVGCGVSSEYIKADQITYDAVAPEYLELVKNGCHADGKPFFTAEEQERRARTIASWKLRIDKGDK